MKKLLVGLMAGLLMLCLSTIASATVMEVTFNGADIMAHATGYNPNTTPVVGDGAIKFTDNSQIATYNRTSSVNDYTAFNSYLDGFTTDEGISKFNLWLMDGDSNQAGLWGETIALTDRYDANITTSASSGWTGSVYTIGTEWGASWEGKKLITYTADTAADYLRIGSTATFGFTADIFATANALGPNYQMWVGADGGDVIDGGTAASLYQRAISVNTAPVPEPATALLLGIGLLSLAGVSRKKR